MEYFIRAGFVDLATITEPTTIEQDLKEPAKFCIKGNDGRIKTIVLKIGKVPTASNSKPVLTQYEITEIKKTDNSSDVGSRTYYKNWTSTEYVPGYSAIEVMVEQIQNDKYKINLQPPRKLEKTDK